MSLAVLVAALLSPPPTTAVNARMFVERIYAGYRDEDYSPLARPGRVFAPALVAEIRKDRRLSRGEVGYLDGDPLCQCQDAAGMRPLIGEVEERSGAANARIQLLFGGSERRSLELRLLYTRAGWRVADVVTADEPSLLEALRRFNERRKGQER